MMTKRDEELCEMFGISLEDVDREVSKVEAGDYSSWDFSRVMHGNPMQKDRMKIITHAGEKTHGFNREDDSPSKL